MKNWKLNKNLWICCFFFGSWMSVSSIMGPLVYKKIANPSLLPGLLAQDIVTLILCILLFFLLRITKENDYKKLIVVFGILGYLFYTYSMYAMERLYNNLYLFYLLLAALSFYSLVFGLLSLRLKPGLQLTVKSWLHYLSLFFTLLVPFIFIPKWISQLLPLLSSGQRIEYLYSIYVLDLVFVMPAFLIVAYLNFKNYLLGKLLTPVLFIKGFTVLFPLVIAEVIKPYYKQVMDFSSMIFYGVLSLIFLFLTVFYLVSLRELGFTKGLIE